MGGINRDLIGLPASKDLRQTPKNYGKRKMVGVIRDGKYIDPKTGDPIILGCKKVDYSTIHINTIGGIE